MQRMQRSRCVELIAVTLLAATLGCGTSDQTPVEPDFEDQGNVETVSESAPDRGPTPDRYAESDHGPVVELDTSYGKIVLRLDVENAPLTVRNFLTYVNAGHYDETVFHYVDPGAIILGGGFSPSLEPKGTSQPIRNEAHNGLKNRRGTVAMSRDFGHIDSATCQFFINLDDNPVFDHQSSQADEYGYCVFGEVIDGMNVADKIGQARLHDVGDFSSTPVAPVVIQSARERPARR